MPSLTIIDVALDQTPNSKIKHEISIAKDTLVLILKIITALDGTFELVFEKEVLEHKKQVEMLKEEITNLRRQVKGLKDNSTNLKSNSKRNVFMGTTDPNLWTVYNSDGITVWVDLSHLKLKKTPVVFTTISGTGLHYFVKAPTSIYELNEKAFRVYAYFPEITLQKAKEYQWCINYVVFYDE